jgi:predicted nucleic acid-binding protein
MKIVISDTNIFIDLLNTALLEDFLKLKIEVHTTDFVLVELYAEQVKILEKKIEDEQLIIDKANEDDLDEIIKLQSEKTSLSINDISVYYFAKKQKAMILTGDRSFRKYAEENEIEVKGILWIFDELLNNELLSKKVLAGKLRTLMKTNKRLPRDEVISRLGKWK